MTKDSNVLGSYFAETGVLLPDYTAYHARRLQTSAASLWEP